MNILDEIIAYKRKEVEERKSHTPVSVLETSVFYNRTPVCFKEALEKAGTSGIIAEFKRQSPSKGVINNNSGIIDVIPAYDENGASAISVLTDNKFFGGNTQDLLDARILTKIPLLRKDFMVNEYQLHEAKAIGADVILLIAAALTPKEVCTMAAAAKKLQLQVLLEIHNEEELQHLNDDVDVVGVNNRNLKTFEVNIQTSLDLINKIPKKFTPISESGISDVKNIITLQQAGFKGFLIGENFMKETDPAIAFAAFIHTLKATQYAH